MEQRERDAQTREFFSCSHFFFLVCVVMMWFSSSLIYHRSSVHHNNIFTYFAIRDLVIIGYIFCKTTEYLDFMLYSKLEHTFNFPFQLFSTMNPSASAISKTSAQLYRDCLRLIRHIAGKSRKGITLQKIVSGEFRKNANVSEPAVLEVLKSNAIRGLANYLMMEATNKDKNFKAATNAFTESEAKSLRNSKQDFNNMNKPDDP